MNDNKKEERVLLGKARQTYKEAELLFDNNYSNAAVNRLYYACFYAVKALLVNKGFNAKKHSGIKQMFGLHFVTSGIISDDSGKFFTQIFEMRQEGDYEFLTIFEKDEVAQLFAPSKQLIDEAEQTLSL